MRRRENGNRAAFSLDNGQTIPCSQRDRIGVWRATKLVLLPTPRHVAPHDSLGTIDLETSQAGSVVVGHGGLVSLRDCFLPEQVSSAIGSELKPSGESAHRESGKRHFNAGPVSLYLAVTGIVRRCGTPNLVGAPRESWVGTGRTRNHQWCIPKRFPLLLLQKGSVAVQP